MRPTCSGAYPRRTHGTVLYNVQFSALPSYSTIDRLSFFSLHCTWYPGEGREEMPLLVAAASLAI